MKLDFIITCATTKNLDLWKEVVDRLGIYYPEAVIVSVVPEIDFSNFEGYRSPRLIFHKDEEILPLQLTNDIRKQAGPRYGWYLQQFLKIEIARIYSKKFEIGMIWDSDSLPLRPLQLFGKNEKILFGISDFFNQAYLDQMLRCLELEKQISGSFISQYIAFRSEWINSFVEKLGGKSDYLETLKKTIDFRETSGFSEYELLGNFFFQNFRQEVDFEPDFSLERYGNSKYGGIKRVGSWPHKYLLRKVNIIAFESWDSLGSIQAFYLGRFLGNLNRFARKAGRKIGLRVLLKGKNLSSVESPTTDFIHEFISLHEKCLILQVGACDGLQNDFLREIILANKDKSSVKFVLIEPLPNYVETLNRNYSEFSNVVIESCAIGNVTSERDFYYIDPSVADIMNGTGPFNNWAHGQGSFSFDKIVESIHANSFRGLEYVSNIPLFIKSIKTSNFATVPLKNFLRESIATLVIIDVQGFEMEVLASLSLSNLPIAIIVENEFEDNRLFNFLSSLGYFRHLTGHDEIYRLVREQV